MTQDSRFTVCKLAAALCRVTLGLGLFAQTARAAPAPQVDAGLDEFRHARFAEAQAAWRQAARAGDPRGALYLGVMYDSGVGLPRDFREAMQWYRQAAAGGSAVAAFNIGVFYDGGFGVAPDPSEAASWYAKAAALGFGRAEYNLALLYESGVGVPRDLSRAEALYRSAASHGVSAANEHLASFREPPEPARREAAASSRRERAEAASPLPDDRGSDETASREFQSAQRAVLTRGAVNAARAASLFRRAAEKHNALAEYDLGYCYEHGLGVPADPATAAIWYHRAASDSSDDSLRAVAQASAGSLEAQPASPPAN